MSQPKTAPPAGPATPATPASLATLVALGVASALWAALLWAQLALARITGDDFCGFGQGGACTRVWDAGLATALHQWTDVPVAGWGVVWGLTALALPLLALVRTPPPAALIGAIRVNAAVGVLSIFVFAAVSLAERSFCVGCFVTYLLVAGYGGIALGWPQRGLPDAGRALGLAAALTLVGWALVIVPGRATPGSRVEAGREAVTTAGGSADSALDTRLEEFVASLNPSMRQTLADSLGIHRRSRRQDLPPAPVRLGPASAPVRIVEWTDVLCDHCAELHETLATLREHTPPGSFSVEPRQFPLDGSCNPMLQPRTDDDGVRCVGARARVCMEGHEHFDDFSAELFAAQRELTTSRVREIAAGYLPAEALDACLASPATQARLEEDARLAAAYDPDGTPIVAVNGRQGTSFPPFLYAIILAGGNADHPAFASLPPANPTAHLH